MEAYMNPAICWCPDNGWMPRQHECTAEYCKRLKTRSQTLEDRAAAGDVNAEVALQFHASVKPVKVRPEPFPNPEPLAYRPKAW